MCDLLGHAPATQSDEDADARIHDLLRFMDPDATTMANRNVFECLVWGGFWVAASDGRIDQVEVEAICRAVKSPLANEAAKAIRKAPEPTKFIRENFDRAAIGCRRLPAAERHAVVQQLIAVARANLAFADRERAALQEICKALGVNPVFPEKVLSQYEVDNVFAQVH
jgi:tellurite resistance protein